MPRARINRQQDAILYVHVHMRKIGHAARNAKLPEGTATSSMIIILDGKPVQDGAGILLEGGVAVLAEEGRRLHVELENFLGRSSG